MKKWAWIRKGRAIYDYKTGKILAAPVKNKWRFERMLRKNKWKRTGPGLSYAATKKSPKLTG